jgi:hypothetical protein
MSHWSPPVAAEAAAAAETALECNSEDNYDPSVWGDEVEPERECDESQGCQITYNVLLHIVYLPVQFLSCLAGESGLLK